MRKASPVPVGLGLFDPEPLSAGVEASFKQNASLSDGVSGRADINTQYENTHDHGVSGGRDDDPPKILSDYNVRFRGE